MNSQMTMLHDVIDILVDGEAITQEQAFLHLLDLIANRIDFDDSVSTPWIKQTTIEKVNHVLSLDLLRQDPWDWFGELHHDLDLYVIKGGDYYISRQELEQETFFFPESSLYKPARILDSIMGTGRNIITMHNILGKTVIIYGVEHDLVAYRIALLNTKIYGIQASLLHADIYQHDVREHSPNWRYANAWTPVTWGRYLSEGDVDERTHKTSQGFYRFS